MKGKYSRQDSFRLVQKPCNNRNGLRGFALLLMAAVVCAAAEGCTGNSSGPLPKDSEASFVISRPRWSADNGKIVFRQVIPGRSEGGWTQDLIYDLSTHRIYEYENAPYYPACSPDGTLLAYAGNSIVGDCMNIFVRGAGGQRRITNNRKCPIVEIEGRKTASNDFEPSFSPDGKRVLFKRSAVLKDRGDGGKRPTDWDVYETDLTTGLERRLTRYRFAEMSQPYYLPDGERFVFSARGPQSGEHAAQYDKTYGNNRIFIMDGRNNTLQPAFVNAGDSAEPHAARNGAIVFLSATNAMDGLPDVPRPLRSVPL